MNIIRRLFGRYSDEWAEGRAPHVTPSDSFKIAQHRLDSGGGAIETAVPAMTETGPAEAVPPPNSQRHEAAADPAAPPVLDSPQHTLTYGIASDTGLVRDNNEDACFAMHWHVITVAGRPDFGFFAVADGMGGHLDGEKAAAIAVQTLAAALLKKIYIPMLRGFKAADSPAILEALVDAAEKANRAVIEDVPGGGTTLSTVAIVDNLAYLVHVGDSRAYLIHHDQIEQLTTDHTLVRRLIEMKELTAEEAAHYPQKNVLYRAIGQNEKIKIERLIRSLAPGSQMLICSDGLWDLVNDDTLKRVILESPSPQAACNRLVTLANEQGGSDNISAIVLKIPANPESSSPSIIDKSR